MKRAAIIFILTLAMVKCNSISAINKQNTAVLDTGKVEQNSLNNTIEFRVNGQLIRTSGWNVSRFHIEGESSEWLNITTDMHNEERTINVNLDGAVAGNYLIDESDPKLRSHGSFFPDYIGDMANSYAFIKGSFTITAIDTVKGIVNGSFSGTVRSLRGETLAITEGRIINAALRPGARYYY